MAEPTTPIPDWASDPTFTAGIETGVAPTLAMSASEVSQGVRPGRFVARKFNWLLRLITSWLSYIEESRPDFAAGDSITQADDMQINALSGKGLELAGGALTWFNVLRAARFYYTMQVDGKLTVDDAIEATGNLKGDSINSTTSISAGGAISAVGNCTAGGNITSSAGSVSAAYACSGATVSATTTVTAGTSVTAGTNITSTAGNITATAGAVSAGTDVTSGRDLWSVGLFGVGSIDDGAFTTDGIIDVSKTVHFAKVTTATGFEYRLPNTGSTTRRYMFVIINAHDSDQNIGIRAYGDSSPFTHAVPGKATIVFWNGTSWLTIPNLGGGGADSYVPTGT